jgi:branched-subunit amino acid ABC-type transport system permease component
VLWRPVRARRGGFMSLFLASIGLALVLREAIFLVAGPQPRSYDVDPYKVYVIGSVRLSGSQAVAIVVAAVAIVLVGLMLSGSSAGRKMRAVADDRALAAVAGIDTTRVVFLTWVVCGLLAGLAGVLAALVQSSFDPNFGFTLLLPIFAAVVLGGIGSAYGALLGGLLLGLATELSTWPGFHGGVNPVYKPVVAFVVLIAVLLVRPRGLLGRAKTL